MGRWLFVFTMVVLAALWVLAESGMLPEQVAEVVQSVLGLACSLIFPLLLLSIYVAPGLFGNLREDLRHSWLRFRTRRLEVEELQRKIAHLAKPYHMVQLGTLYAMQGQPALAIPWLRKALEKDPSSLEARYRLGLCHFAQKDFSQAAELLEQVHAKEPGHDYGLAYLRLAESQQHVGNLSRAGEVYEALLRFYPGQPEGTYHFALLQAERGDLDRARTLMHDVMFTVRHSPGFQRRRNRHWSLKAWWWLRRH
jgi:tetratricopeptide (TPR) repeat protein